MLHALEGFLGFGGLEESCQACIMCAEQRTVHGGSNPPVARMRGDKSNRRGSSSLVGEACGMEKPIRAQSRKVDTDKADLQSQGSGNPKGRVSDAR